MIYIIECIGECYEIVADLARKESGAREGAPNDQNSSGLECAKLGFTVTEMVKRVNCALSTTMVISHMLVLIAVVANLYCLMDIFFFPWNERSYLHMFRLIAENTLYIIAPAITSHCGQRLENRRGRAREALEDLQRRSEYLGRRDMQDFKILISRMDSQEPLLSPHSFFSMNHKGYLGITSTVVTYLIVLLQFRSTNT